MSAPQEEIARAVARRLEGEVGPKLPMYVEKLIALGEDAGEAPPQYSDLALVIALASFAFSAGKTAWDVYWKLVEEKRRDADQALSPGEIRLLREQLAREIRESARFSEVVPSRMRIAAVENMADATMEEAKRHEAKP